MGKILIPSSGGSGFKSEVASAVAGLLGNSNVRRFDVSVDKSRRSARIRAVADDGRSSTTDILAPGLISTVTSMPGTKRSFDEKVTALFHQGYNQTESGRILDRSQAHISKTQRRLGLR